MMVMGGMIAMVVTMVIQPDYFRHYDGYRFSHSNGHCLSLLLLSG
jgi:hypothetical protein